MTRTKQRETKLLMMDDDTFIDASKNNDVKSRMLVYYFGGHQYALKKKIVLSLLAFKKTSNNQIARYIGVSRQAASVAILAMEKEGILRRKGKNLVLTKPEFLWLLISRDIIQEDVLDAKGGKLLLMQKRALKFVQHEHFKYFFETMVEHLNGKSAAMDDWDVPAVVAIVGYSFWMVFKAYHSSPKEYGDSIPDKKMKRLLIDCWEWFMAKESRIPPELSFAEEMTGIHVGFD